MNCNTTLTFHSALPPGIVSTVDSTAPNLTVVYFLSLTLSSLEVNVNVQGVHAINEQEEVNKKEEKTEEEI